MTLVKTKTLKAAQSNPKVREMSLPFSGSKVCISASVPPTFPLSSATVTKDKCMLGHLLKEQHWLLRLHPHHYDSVENDVLHGKSSSINFFSGAFERFIANLHISSRKVTRLVLIKDYILDFKNSHLRVADTKLPHFCSWLRFFLLLLQSANGKFLFSAVYLAGRKIANIRSEGDWWGRHYIFIYFFLIFLISMYKGDSTCSDPSPGDGVPLLKVTYLCLYLFALEPTYLLE